MKRDAQGARSVTAGEGQDTATAHLSAFAHHRFRRFFPCSCFSTLGSWTVRFLLGWSAWDLTHSATWVGVVAGLMLAPAFLLSPIFGIVSDRINPRNGLLVTISGAGLIAGFAALALLADWYSLELLLALALALGAVTAAHTPIRLALVPRLVPRQSLPSAIGYSAMVFNTSRILGPALGAWLLSVSSIATAYACAMLLFATALPLLLSVKGIAATPAGGPSGMGSQLLAGLRYVRGHRAIRLVFGYTLVNALLGRTVIELLPAISGQLLQGDSTTLATLTATAGAGSIAGGLLVSRQGGDEGRLLAMITAGLVIGALSLLPALCLHGLTALGAVILCLSLITTVVGTGSQALAQLLVEDGYRGRVLSLWTVLAMGAPAIGALLMGVLADRFGFAAVLIGFGLAALLAIARLYSLRAWLQRPETAGAADR